MHHGIEYFFATTDADILRNTEVVSGTGGPCFVVELCGSVLDAFSRAGLLT
jgi:hypothetical protein